MDRGNPPYLLSAYAEGKTSLCYLDQVPWDLTNQTWDCWRFCQSIPNMMKSHFCCHNPITDPKPSWIIPISPNFVDLRLEISVWMHPISGYLSSWPQKHPNLLDFKCGWTIPSKWMSLQCGPPNHKSFYENHSPHISIPYWSHLHQLNSRLGSPLL